MAKNSTEKSVRRRRAPAMTPEDRENMMISLATDVAEKQLREGTASAQVIVHYLKLGTTKHKLEKEVMEEQKKVLSSKAESLDSTKKAAEGYKEVVKAISRYRGAEEDDYDDEDDDYDDY